MRTLFCMFEINIRNMQLFKSTSLKILFKTNYDLVLNMNNMEKKWIFLPLKSYTYCT